MGVEGEDEVAERRALPRVLDRPSEQGFEFRVQGAGLRVEG